MSKIDDRVSELNGLYPSLYLFAVTKDDSTEIHVRPLYEATYMIFGPARGDTIMRFLDGFDAGFRYAQTLIPQSDARTLVP